AWRGRSGPAGGPHSDRGARTVAGSNRLRRGGDVAAHLRPGELDPRGGGVREVARLPRTFAERRDGEDPAARGDDPPVLQAGSGMEHPEIVALVPSEEMESADFVARARRPGIPRGGDHHGNGG